MKLKLLTKNITYNIIVSIVVSLTAEISLYLFLSYKINKETEEHLYHEYKILKNKIDEGTPVSAFQNNIGDKLYFKEIKSIEIMNPVIEDANLEEEEEEGYENNPYHEERFVSKQIIFDVEQGGKFYRLSLEKTIDEDEGLSESLIIIILVSTASLFTLLFIVNYFIYRRLLRPFKRALKELKAFNLAERKPLQLIHTNTAEFAELNEAVKQVTQRSIEEYTMLKEFTENTSHELQTPLSIINSKIEICLQDGNLTEKQAQNMSDALHALERLSQINQSLLMLTKLENNLYESIENINVSGILLDRIEYFSDFFQNKNIEVIVENNAETPINIKMNRSLCKVLFENLIKNAIKYNYTNGKVIIKLQQDYIEIMNTGPKPNRPTANYFSRFYRSGDSDSLGLGLAICDKICDLYKIDIDYNYVNELHTISLSFKNKA